MVVCVSGAEGWDFSLSPPWTRAGDPGWTHQPVQTSRLHTFHSFPSFRSSTSHQPSLLLLLGCLGACKELIQAFLIRRICLCGEGARRDRGNATCLFLRECHCLPPTFQCLAPGKEGHEQSSLCLCLPVSTFPGLRGCLCPSLCC